MYDGLMACKKSKVSRDELRQVIQKDKSTGQGTDCVFLHIPNQQTTNNKDPTSTNTDPHSFFLLFCLASQALRMYINAVDSGNLIITLPRLASSAPSSSSSSRHQTSRKKAAYSGPSPESLKITLSLELGCIKSLPTDNKELMWVFRRHGYSERENPDHLVTVLSSQMSRGTFSKYHQ